MPSNPPSASPTAIAVAATRTVVTARVALSGQVAAAPPKTSPPYKTCALRVLQRPLRPANQFPKNQIDHRAPFGQRKRRPWSIVEDQRGQKPSRGWLLEISCKIQQCE